MLGRRHQPRAGVAGDALHRPLLERGDQSVLRQFLGDPDIAHYPRETSNKAGRLDPPDCVNGTVGVGAMGVDSGHRFRSHHLPLCHCKRPVRRATEPSSAAAIAKSSRGFLDVGRELRHLVHLADLDDFVV
jgi:hypothetical protein